MQKNPTDKDNKPINKIGKTVSADSLEETEKQIKALRAKAILVTRKTAPNQPPAAPSTKPNTTNLFRPPVLTKQEQERSQDTWLWAQPSPDVTRGKPQPS